MEQHQGFSLIEVLVSLSLLTSVALPLLQQHQFNKHLLNRLIWREQNSYAVEYGDELLWLAIKNNPQDAPGFKLANTTGRNDNEQPKGY